MENRDKTPVGEISPKPNFWGPFDEFQTVVQGGFASDDWLRYRENYYGAHNWRVKKVSRRQNYSKHSRRMPVDRRNVFYQYLMLEKADV